MEGRGEGFEVVLAPNLALRVSLGFFRNRGSICATPPLPGRSRFSFGIRASRKRDGSKAASLARMPALRVGGIRRKG
jgi:hypothetical protein